MYIIRVRNFSWSFKSKYRCDTYIFLYINTHRLLAGNIIILIIERRLRKEKLICQLFEDMVDAI